jgi:hypothetical protein
MQLRLRNEADCLDLQHTELRSGPLKTPNAGSEPLPRERFRSPTLNGRWATCHPIGSFQGYSSHSRLGVARQVIVFDRQP